LYFSITLLAISLSLDALGVGLVYGLRRISIPLSSKLLICLFSIIYSGLALLVGKSLSSVLPTYISQLLGVIILSAMGVWIIIQALLRKSDDLQFDADNANRIDKTIFKLVIKSLGITVQIIKNPIRGDIDKSGVIDKSESLLLGFALSLDAIGVGIGSGLAGFHSMLIPMIVGLFQLVFLYTGLYLGMRFSMFERINKRLLAFLPGILLILLAFIRIL